MKKFLAIGLVFILALSLLTNCGNNNHGDSNGSSKPTSTAAKEPVTVELNKVIIDVDALKVTLTRYE